MLPSARADLCRLAREQLRPQRVVVINLNRTGQRLQLADRVRANLLLGVRGVAEQPKQRGRPVGENPPDVAHHQPADEPSERHLEINRVGNARAAALLDEGVGVHPGPIRAAALLVNKAIRRFPA